MPTTYKSLGQSNPVAGALTDAYTVGVSKSAVISSIAVCNSSNQSAKFRVMHAVAGAADDPKQRIFYDVTVPANDTFVATIGVTMAATDVLRVYSSNGVTSFQIWGAEMS